MVRITGRSVSENLLDDSVMWTPKTRYETHSNTTWSLFNRDPE
jgi:hypothetical protein